MQEEITDEQISQLCMYMRIIELMKRNPQVLEKKEIKKGYDDLCKKVDVIMKLLSPEEMNIVLETHKKQLQEIEEEEAKKQAKR